MEEDRPEHIKHRIEEISKIIDILWEVAEKDDMVTPDEQAIIENIQENLENYRQLANKLKKNKEVSDDDLARLYIFEKKIVQDASARALLDGHITGEEGDILQKLIDFLEELNQESK